MTSNIETEWQSIESAPKGEWILVWRPDMIVQCAALCRIDDKEWWTRGKGGPINFPTHWMPLPNPPEVK